MDQTADEIKITKEDYSGILDTVFESLKHNGFKATRMDDIAAQLSMSKRTLYEIFGSKEKIIIEALRYSKKKTRLTVSRFFAESENVIEALIKTVIFHQAFIQDCCPDFFIDIDNHNKILRQYFNKDTSSEFHDDTLAMLKLGVQQGVFRPDLDYRFNLRIFIIQMEALKRCDDLMPTDINKSQIYLTVGLNFLRAISTPSGCEILDHYIKENNIDINIKNFDNLSEHKD